MKKFAVVKDAIVDNVIIAESLEIAQSLYTNNYSIVEIKDGEIAHIGLSYDGQSFEQPTVEEPETTPPLGDFPTL